MRRVVVAVFSFCAVLAMSLIAPASAQTLAAPVANGTPILDDVPASALDSQLAPSGSINTYWLANSQVYWRNRSALGGTGVTAVMDTSAPQMPGVTPKIQVRTNVAGDIAITYTCADQRESKLCLIIRGGPTGNRFPGTTLAVSGVTEFDSAWVGNEFHIFYAYQSGGLGPFDAPKTAVSRVVINSNFEAVYDQNVTSWSDANSTLFHASHVTVTEYAGWAAYSWESYESTNAQLGYVIRSTVIPGGQSQGTSRVVANLAQSRVRALKLSFLEAASGRTPVAMWVTDLTVDTAVQSPTGEWVLGSSVALAGQALLTDIMVTDQLALQAVVKTRHLTTPSLSSFTITDSRLPITSTTVMANALPVTSLKSYQLAGGNPAVLVCSASGVSLLETATGATVRTHSDDGNCASKFVYDHAGQWIWYGISTNYSATQNSAHALLWIDSAAPIDLRTTTGQIVSQKMVVAGKLRVAALVLRQWTDPAFAADTRDKLQVQVYDPDNNANYQNVTVSEPGMRISNVHLVEMSSGKVVLLWQEIHPTLVGTTASSVLAKVFDVASQQWSATATATVPGRPIVTFSAVAEVGNGTGQLGSTVLLDSFFSCTLCGGPLHGLLSFDVALNTFSVAGAEPGQDSPAFAAQALPNGETAWIFASAATNFEPWVYVRTAAGQWRSGAPLALPLSAGTLTKFAVATSATAEGPQGVVVYSTPSDIAGANKVVVQQLSITAGAVVLGSPLIVNQVSQLDGDPILDGRGQLYFVARAISAGTGVSHHIVKIFADNSIQVGDSISSADTLVADAAVDSLGRAAIAWNDGPRVALWQADGLGNDATTLGSASVYRSLDLEIDSGDSGYTVAWHRDTQGSLLISSMSYAILQQAPAATTYCGMKWQSLTAIEITLCASDRDPYTRYEYRANAYSGQSFTGGVDADGIFTITGLAITMDLTLDFRVISNFGTAQETAGVWTTQHIPGVPVNRPYFTNLLYKSPTTYYVDWASLGDYPYEYEVHLTQNGKTYVAKTTGTSYLFTGIDISLPTTFTMRATLGDVASAWFPDTTLPGVKRPTTPAIASLKSVAKSLTLKWKPIDSVGAFGITGYKVEMRVGTAAWKSVASLKVNVLSWTLKKPLKGKKYSFRVTALGPLNGPASAIKSLTFKG